MRVLQYHQRLGREILQALWSRHGAASMTARLGVGRWALGVVMVAMLSTGAFAQDMPDPSLIHGRAIPAQELANGTVTVRVVREAIGNNAPGQQVRVTVGGTTRTATTDAQGRAEFTDLPKGGANAIAEVTVDGEKLVSQPFAVPASGGLRVILVAGIAKAAERKKQEEASAGDAPSPLRADSGPPGSRQLPGLPSGRSKKKQPRPPSRPPRASSCWAATRASSCSSTTMRWMSTTSSRSSTARGHEWTLAARWSSICQRAQAAQPLLKTHRRRRRSAI